ncbi:abc transporter, partial [Fusarium albosuccineum]
IRGFASVYLLACVRGAVSFDQTFAWSSSPVVENRSLDEIHQAALKEGGTVTLWHGGSKPDQQDQLKNAFEERFPGMTLNVTVKSSSYLGPELDRQLATGSLYVGNVMLQTAQDYPRWRDQGVLVNAWSILYNKDKLKDIDPPTTFLDFLRPEFKNKIVLAFPNEDDAVLHTFDLIMKEHGLEYFDKLLQQNPKWVAGADAPAAEIGKTNSTFAVSFTTTIGLFSQDPLMVVFPTEGAYFTSWSQRAAIFADAPHPESAKLLQSYIISEEYQNQTGSWSIRKDVAAPDGYSGIFDTPNTDPTHFVDWMMDRERVERLRFWFQDKLGYPKH